MCHLTGQSVSEKLYSANHLAWFERLVDQHRGRHKLTDSPCTLVAVGDAGMVMVVMQPQEIAVLGNQAPTRSEGACKVLDIRRAEQIGLARCPYVDASAPQRFSNRMRDVLVQLEANPSEPSCLMRWVETLELDAGVGVVKCQFTLVEPALRSRSHTAVSRSVV